MSDQERSSTKNALTAILLYELSRLEMLEPTTQVKIAASLLAAIQAMRMSSDHATDSFHQNQASFFAALKRDTLAKNNHSSYQVELATASIMYCIFKGHEIEGLQSDLIKTTLAWVKKSSDFDQL
jgi:hypothetical protein